MKLSVGYQLAEPGECSFVDIVAEYADHVGEVYFPWLAMASGRSPIGGREGQIEPTAWERFTSDLQALRHLDVKLNLLFNANCYGGDAMSEGLAATVTDVIERLGNLVDGPDSVTTTSPAIAWVLKQRFPAIPVRASVNMRIGSIEGMRYLADRFDEYCVQREMNRDLDHLARLRQWADSEGKRLSILVNSGCLRNCSGQSFHDNLVAHETAAAGQPRIEGFMPYTCWNFLRDRANWPAVLQATWIRPEDLHHYDELFPTAKLATRLHERPHIVIGAYARRRFRGNLLDLFEPGFSHAFAPYIIDNAAFPEDWFEHVGGCRHDCLACGYCATVLEQVLVDLRG